MLASLDDVELSGVRDSDLCQKLKPVGVDTILSGQTAMDDVSLAPFVLKC